MSDGYIYHKGVKLPAPPTNAELAAQVASHAKSINDLIDLLDSIVKIKKV